MCRALAFMCALNCFKSVLVMYCDINQLNDLDYINQLNDIDNINH